MGRCLFGKLSGQEKEEVVWTVSNVIEDKDRKLKEGLSRDAKIASGTLASNLSDSLADWRSDRPGQSIRPQRRDGGH